MAARSVVRRGRVISVDMGGCCKGMEVGDRAAAPLLRRVQLICQQAVSIINEKMKKLTKLSL